MLRLEASVNGYYHLFIIERGPNECPIVPDTVLGAGVREADRVLHRGGTRFFSQAMIARLYLLRIY